MIISSDPKHCHHVLKTFYLEIILDLKNSTKFPYAPLSPSGNILYHHSTSTKTKKLAVN